MANIGNSNPITWLDKPQPLFIGGSVIAATFAVIVEWPGEYLGVIFLGICVVTLCSWSLTSVPNLNFAVAIMAVSLVALGWTTDDPESALFQIVLLAAAVGWKTDSTRLSVLLVLVLTSVPIIGIMGPNEAHWGWWNWNIGILFTWTLGRLIRVLEATLNELTEARGQLIEVAAREERRRISRDVHDLVGHSLTAMLLNVRAAQQDFKKNPTEALKALDDAEKTGVRGVEDIRVAMVGLRSDAVSGKSDKAEFSSLPDGESIQLLLDRQSHLSIKTTGDLRRLNGPVAIALYRILQECITNISKHSTDGTGNLELSVQSNSIKLLADNASTKSTRQDVSQSTLGLIGMRERIAALGGTFSAKPHNERWHLECRLPIE